MPTCSIHCKDKIPKIRNKYSQKRNCLDRSAYSAAVKYANWFWEYMNRSQTHESGSWDWGRAIPFLGLHKWDSRCSVYIYAIFLAFAVYLQERRQIPTTRERQKRRRRRTGGPDSSVRYSAVWKRHGRFFLLRILKVDRSFPQSSGYTLYTSKRNCRSSKRSTAILPTAESRCPNKEVSASGFFARNLTFRLIISFRYMCTIFTSWFSKE